jgi:hypothetical protein
VGHGVASLGLQAMSVPVLKTMVGRGHDELVRFGVFLIRVRPVLKTKVKAVFGHNGVDPIEVLRDVSIHP